MEYQETMNLDIENISSKNQQIWRSMYEVIHDDYFKAVELFLSEFLDQCKKMNLVIYQMKSNQSFRIYGFGKWVVCTSGYDLPNGFR